jgi:hypothetical protein
VSDGARGLSDGPDVVWTIAVSAIFQTMSKDVDGRTKLQWFMDRQSDRRPCYSAITKIT